jgi:hypothetical protein
MSNRGSVINVWIVSNDYVSTFDERHLQMQLFRARPDNRSRAIVRQGYQEAIEPSGVGVCARERTVGKRK